MPNFKETEFYTGSQELALGHFTEICVLYDDVFSRPPFHWREDESALHAERLTRIATDPTFGIVLARVAESIVGFAYGYTVDTNTRRWQSMTVPLSDDAAMEWSGRTFLLFDFAVAAAHRGRGIGKQLHDRLLSSRLEQRATLTVQPTAVETKKIYEHWGWRLVGQMEGGPTAAAPIFDAYVIEDLDAIRQSNP